VAVACWRANNARITHEGTIMSSVASPSPIGQSFRKIFTREQVEQIARRTGWLQRQGKLDVYLFALTLVVAAVSAQRWSYSQIAAVIHALGGLWCLPRPSNSVWTTT
jgi:hypothetical protein